jgi:hypothetical protein
MKACGERDSLMVDVRVHSQWGPDSPSAISVRLHISRKWNPIAIKSPSANPCSFEVKHTVGQLCCRISDRKMADRKMAGGDLSRGAIYIFLSIIFLSVLFKAAGGRRSTR